jgi:AraC-like DNA-binding protein
MKIERYTPPAILKPFIKSIMIIESESGMVNKILPDTSMVMAFRIKGNVIISNHTGEPLPSFVLSGISTSPRSVMYARETSVILVLFNEGGIIPFIQFPIYELRDNTVSLSEFFSRQDINDLEIRLLEAVSNRKRIDVIEGFLISKLSDFKPDHIVNKAISYIRQANGKIKIYDLPRLVYLSMDALEKRFRSVTGTSPKHFASIVRLRHIINNYSVAESLTSTAYDADYFDQSHFTRDFKMFTGQTPSQFFRTFDFW